MSVLDTFYILFKSDAKDVKKGAEEAEKSVKALDRNLKNVDRDSKQIGKSFLQMAESFSNIIASGYAATTLISGVKHALEYGQELSKTSKLLNINASELQAWGGAVELAGGTAAGFEGSLNSLAEHFNTSTQTALKLLPRLADGFSRLNQAQAFKYGKSLGLDENTILLLQKGRREVESIIDKEKQRKLLSKENIEIFNKYRIATVENTHAQQDFYNAIALQVIPVLTEFQKSSSHAFGYLTEHKDLIEGALKAISAAVVALGIRIAIASPQLAAFAAALGAFAVAYEDVKLGLQGNPNTVFNKIQRRLGVDTNSITAKYGPNPFAAQVGNLSASQNSLIPGNTLNSGNNKTQSVNINSVTINTASTDANGVVDALQNWKNQLFQSNSYFDNGVNT